MFGKNLEYLTGISPFGSPDLHIALARSQLRPWGDTEVFAPPAFQAARVRLVAGHYPTVRFDENDRISQIETPWLELLEHYDSLTRERVVCSAGPYWKYRGRREPCLGCDLYLADRDRSRGAGRAGRHVGLRNMRVFSVALLDATHLLERASQPTASAPTSRPRALVPCGGVGCRYCGSRDQRKADRVVSWPLGPRDFENLMALDREVAGWCAGCGSMAGLRPVGVDCGACGAKVLDGQDVAPTHLETLLSIPHCCPDCEHWGLFGESLACETCREGGTVPRRATVFDLDLKVRALRTPDRGTEIRFTSEGRPRPTAEGLASLDLAELFRPAPPDEQARRWRIAAPATDLRGRE